MKALRYIQLIVVALTLGIVTSCTRNNGDIGPWYGEWHLQSIDINGVDDDSYPGNVLWKFQSNIVEMVTVTGHTHTEHYGTWSESADELILDYTHSDNANAPGSSKYAPPQCTHLPAAIVSLRIIKKSSSELILSYSPDADTVIVYTLRKRG